MLRALPTLLLGLAMGCVAASQAEESVVPATPAVSLLRAIDEGFVQIFEKVAPAVVVIETTKAADDEEGREDWRGFLFRDGAEPEPEGGKGEERPRFRLPHPPTASEGSGFIIRANGFILTNRHVVADAEKLQVRLKDGRKFAAKVIGSDDKTDIAVLKIEAKDLPVAEFGDSDKLRVGQLVCAIGAPYSQDYSFTCGWVSGKGRTNLLGMTSPAFLYEDYIQTDAFINPGNSGGPLFDVDGRIVGMNTLINGIGRGLAFAIPANLLAEVGNELIATGRVRWSWIGISMQDFARSQARERTTGIEHGVLVKSIVADAPAYKSDLRADDVITEADGVKLATARELQKEVLKKKIGQIVQLTVWREGTTVKLPITMGERPASLTTVANISPKTGGEPLGTIAGLELKDAKDGGAAVVSVEPGSAAARAELQVGDVIGAIEAKPVVDSAAARSALKPFESNSKRSVTLSIERKGKRISAVLELGR